MKKKATLVLITWYLILFVLAFTSGHLILFFLKLGIKIVQLLILSKYIEFI